MNINSQKDWNKTNKCLKNKKGHYFSIEYNNSTYCEYCGENQNVRGLSISEDLLEHLKEEKEKMREKK